MGNIVKIVKIFLIFHVLICTFQANAFAQNKNNNIQVAGTGSGFTLSSASNLENAQTVSNAITVTVQSKNNKCSIYAEVSSMSTTTGTPMPASMLALQLSSVSPPMSANFNAVPLSQTNQLLFQSSSSFSQENLVYNLILGPVGYSYAAGAYTFNLLFTMTQP